MNALVHTRKPYSPPTNPGYSHWLVRGIASEANERASAEGGTRRRRTSAGIGGKYGPGGRRLRPCRTMAHRARSCNPRPRANVYGSGVVNVGETHGSTPRRPNETRNGETQS